MSSHTPGLASRRAVATVTAAALALSPMTLRAGDLNAEVNNMFNSLGTIGNYTAPGAFRGQTFNTYTAVSYTHMTLPTSDLA